MDFLGNHNMAICYKNGFGCEKNEKKAFEFMEKAANLGCVDGNFFQFFFFLNQNISNS